ncbi:unnamed protein product [Ectocarpus sp. 8 AP-2014]
MAAERPSIKEYTRVKDLSCIPPPKFQVEAVRLDCRPRNSQGAMWVVRNSLLSRQLHIRQPSTTLMNTCFGSGYDACAAPTRHAIRCISVTIKTAIPTLQGAKVASRGASRGLHC